MARYASTRDFRSHHISILGLCLSFLLAYHCATFTNYLFTQRPHAVSVSPTPIAMTMRNIAQSKPFMCSLLSNSGLRKLMRFPITPSNPRSCSLYLCMLLLSCGDIESHPGPSYYPCAYCQLNVDWNCSGVCCDNCSVWLHRSCADLSTSAYNKLSNISTSWRCYRCNITNHSGSYFHSYDLEISNAFDILSRLPSNSDISFESTFAGVSPSKCSTPVTDSHRAHNTANQQPQTFRLSSSGYSAEGSSRSTRGSRSSEHSTSGPTTKNPNNWRSVTINCNSVSGKRAELANLAAYTDPDVLVLTETKIDHTVHPSEFLPDGYNCAACKDRNRSGGGVMLAFKSCYSVEAIELENIDAETAWASVLSKQVSKINNWRLLPTTRSSYLSGGKPWEGLVPNWRET